MSASRFVVGIDLGTTNCAVAAVDTRVRRPRVTLVGIPHTPGTREYLTCERGQIELRVSGDAFVLAAGDVVVFRGDQRHSYKSLGNVEAVAYSVIAFAPTGS